MRNLLKSLLRPFATEFRECSDGAQAPCVYDEQGPDLVLMDICMKEVDGITAAKQIHDADPSARIVMVTDYDDDALREAAQKAGACGYVLKDDLSDLIRLVQPT
jgi:DNA-binding NarL/FixJ family response regulator